MNPFQIIREEELFQNQHKEIRNNADNLFTWLLSFQWILAITIAEVVSPFTWNGSASSILPHVLAAFFLGGMASFYPIYCFHRNPGAHENGYLACVGQMFYSILLIHITGGRIETHFHIFGSLAFLSFYRNSKVVITATLITTVDHFWRGAFMPSSLYGVTEASNWRALEHVSWVVFEDIFLLIAINAKKKGMRLMAHREYALEESIANTEKIVEVRTRDLQASQKTILNQQQNLINAERLSSLGEMASGIAHEINNPLAIIGSTSKLIRIKAQQEMLSSDVLLRSLDDIDATVGRVSKIINGLRNISRISQGEAFKDELLSNVFSDVLAVCQERFKNYSIKLELVDSPILHKPRSLHRVQLSQVFLNLLSNSFDALKVHDGERWIRIKFEEDEEFTRILFTDSGPGIPLQHRSKLFQPFFTTKEVGQGTGLGLSLSRSILENHGGELKLNESQGNTEFIITLPRKGPGILTHEFSTKDNGSSII